MDRPPCAWAVMLVALVACVRPALRARPVPDACQAAMAHDADARAGRRMAWVGLGVGTLMAVVGFSLAAHGAEIRSAESSAEDEDGIGEVLGGALLGAAGASTVLASGIAIGVYTSRISNRLSACDASP